MRTAFISDIHANRDALEVVLADIREQSVDRIVCLGDIVGYGPEPNECVARVQEVCEIGILGNHDHAALGRMDTLAFNEYARAAADWTSEALDEASRTYLASLPLETTVDGMRLVHASPREPDRWHYILSFEEARRQFEAFGESLCFIGHSHLPIVIEEEGSEVYARRFHENEPIALHADRRFIVNVGSVGQPRDRDPRAGYVWFDHDERLVVLRRLDYPVETVQDKILAAGLPGFLASRLASGV